MNGEPVTVERLEKALVLLAYIIELHGPVYTPLYDNIERALAEARRTQSTQDRARKLLAAYRAEESGTEGSGIEAVLSGKPNSSEGGSHNRRP